MTYSMNAALANTPDDVFVRPVGSMERFFHLYAREHPRHFCVVAEISGDIDALDFQTAFDRVQRRHPMLSAYIAGDVRSGPSIFHCDHRKLPVAVVASTEPGDWHAIVERELRTPFVDSEAPLMRATVLRARRQGTVVLTLHHALLDGLSAAVIVRDLLEALKGHELKPLPALPSLDQLLEEALLPHGQTIQMRAPAGVDAEKLRAIARMPLWRPFEGDHPIVSTVSFSAAEAERIRRRSRDESTTVHGALCAALVRTAAKPPNEAFTITSPVNARGVLGNVDAHAGFLFSLATVNLSAPFDRPLWDIARKVTDDMADARTNDGVL
ncbi:MAG TPA: condensation domain-containing protein, partial [Bryobacteraceae bacterium]|nr:condensation domain-containing protein [Bryobacteraceae bacterium]